MERKQEEQGIIAAVVLAAGLGKRMNSTVPKQFMELAGRPMITYALEAFEKSPVDQVVLVAGAEELEYCRREIVSAWGFRKVTGVVAGGKERYHSVYEGLKALEDCAYVLIHDGARPLVDESIIRAALGGAREYGACVVGMPVKDTIKVSDAEGFAVQTPDRSALWQVQTPQAFAYRLVREAYDRLMAQPALQKGITDDAMVVESLTGERVKLILGSYKNMKVTTPEDMEIAEVFLRGR